MAAIGARVLDALRAAHATGVLHRDVKPENVLLADDGRVVLTDFGIASLEAEAGLTATGGLVGTPAYMPPERLNGEPARPEADLWSLGATLYAAAEGAPPFAQGSEQATLSAVVTSAPAPFDKAGSWLRSSAVCWRRTLTSAPVRPAYRRSLSASPRCSSRTPPPCRPLRRTRARGPRGWAAGGGRRAGRWRRTGGRRSPWRR